MDVELARLSTIGLVRVMMASSHADLSDLIGHGRHPRHVKGCFKPALIQVHIYFSRVA